MPLEHLTVFCPHCGKELREQQMTRQWAEAIFSDHLTATASCRFDETALQKQGATADHIRMMPGTRPIAES